MVIVKLIMKDKSITSHVKMTIVGLKIPDSFNKIKKLRVSIELFKIHDCKE